MTIETIEEEPELTAEAVETVMPLSGMKMEMRSSKF